MDYGHPALADRLAADYVAGTLRGAARRRFEALLPAHPGLRHAVEAWQDRLLPLTGSVEPQTPPAVVWQRIQARLGGPAPASAATAPRWWQRLLLWQGLSAGALAGLVAALLWLGSPGLPQPPLIVVLEPTAPAATPGVVRASFVASVSADGRSLSTRPLGEVALQADRALELWALPAGAAPRSLGLISPLRSTAIRRDRLPAGTEGLAVSLEPPGGSPTGAPTGPVLYVGKFGT
ncbi:anti-sigma factor [Piscinibacter sakaiensis]|uniref:Anti-sigma K factor RskA C-terminal domain-containing protein n=1 Tax=Piscinibacter sakaiensis TaxID=1547922 RepID=A0A0K8P0E1_PISS1|nr:anti-sigma factor [Piscinibacter sakaiensis]GAP36009.1 hypothetical protein ISF6_1849 [Piscinibacter sakaiensis]